AVRLLPATRETVRTRARGALALGGGRLEGSIREDAGDGSAQTRRDRLGGVLDHGAGRRPAQVHGGGEPKIPQAHRLLELERSHPEIVPGQPGVQEEAVEIAALEPGILERQLDSIDGEAEWRAPVDPPLRSDPEPDDGGRAAQRMCRHASRSTAGAGGE